ncbi:MAG: hypothetical protein R6X02_21740 [Enhygromyxa sp.]
MRRFGLSIGLLLGCATIMLPTPAAIAAEQAEVDAAYVKVALTRGGKTHAHPGFRVGKDEQGVFVIECEGKNHEIAVVLHEGDADKLQISVEYSVDGRQLLREELQVEAGKDAQLGKGETKLAINVDPRGKKDTSRKDEDKIDGPDSDDPLGGM